MKIIYFGSSTFSLPVLAALLTSPYSVVQVVTTPDRKQGRGQTVSPSIVKRFAREQNLPVIEPEKPSEPKVLATIKMREPDLLIIASYGKIVPSPIFKCPKVAALNVHPSLLPRHRGASPIQQAILQGDSTTGVSIAEVTNHLDAGDLFGQVSTPIDENENALELSKRLAELAATLLLKVLDQFASKTIARKPQDESKATYAKKLEKNQGHVNWSQSAREIHNQIRACFPWPSAFTSLRGRRVKIIKARPLGNRVQRQQDVGTIVDIAERSGIQVQTRSGVLILEHLQLEGRRQVDAYEFALGQRLSPSDRFT